MILDTSAVVAVLQHEPEAERFATAISAARVATISAANWFEAAIILDSRADPQAVSGFAEFFDRFGIAIAPVTVAEAARARTAYRVWGKGNHPARLNLGDCFAYALAKERGEPLLFKGGDFARTDIVSALG